MWNLKYDANEPTCEIQTDHKHRNQTCGCQWGGSWGGMEWEVGVSRCKLLCIEWINTKVLLCSTENYIHYPMIKHNGKEYEKEYICIT